MAVMAAEELRGKAFETGMQISEEVAMLLCWGWYL